MNTMKYVLFFSLLSVAAAYNHPDLPPGPYCGNGDKTCCVDREDDCSRRILDTLCYCDEFCDRNHDDCCPDYQPVCKGITEPPEELVQPCKHNGKIYLEGETRVEDCNTCTCVKDVFNPKNLNWNCEKDQCLMNAEVVRGINRGASWRAYNYSQFFGKKLREGIKYKLGTNPLSPLTKNMGPIRYDKEIPYPTQFDARDRWPGYISPIVDQEWCASDWAISIATIASDRLAIQSNGAEKVVLSPQTLLSCNRRQQGGCEGGNIDVAWNYMRAQGLVDEECFPYRAQVTKCKLVKNGNLVDDGCRIPVKERTSRYKVSPPGRLGNEKDIMYDIMESGPVQAIMKVYQDFYHYRDGIYRHSYYGDQVMHGLHSVRIVGWGEINGDRYWIAANSWGCDWGENGYFKIARGSNESGIESFVVTVLSEVASANRKK